MIKSNRTTWRQPICPFCGRRVKAHRTLCDRCAPTRRGGHAKRSALVRAANMIDREIAAAIRADRAHGTGQKPYAGRT